MVHKVKIRSVRQKRHKSVVLTRIAPRVADKQIACCHHDAFCQTGPLILARGSESGKGFVRAVAIPAHFGLSRFGTAIWQIVLGRPNESG